MKCKVLTLLTKKIYFTLIMNVVAIRKQLEFDGIYHHGYVDFGVGFNSETVEKASEYFFLVVAINESWKLPVGYLLQTILQVFRK